MASVEFDSYTSLRSDPNLVAYYKLENTSAEVGSTLTNLNTATFDAGKWNNGVTAVDATNKCLWLNSNFGITSGAITIMFWAKPTADPREYDTMVDLTVGTPDFLRYAVMYRTVAGVKKIWWNRGRTGVADQGYNVNQTLTNGNWYHFALTWNGSTTQGYLNGDPHGAGSSDAGSGSASAVDNFVIGGRSADAGGVNTDWIFDGMVDDVVVFNRALTATEIYNFYNGGGSPGATVQCSTLSLMGCGH